MGKKIHGEGHIVGIEKLLPWTSLGGMFWETAPCFIGRLEVEVRDKVEYLKVNRS